MYFPWAVQITAAPTPIKADEMYRKGSFKNRNPAWKMPYVIAPPTIAHRAPNNPTIGAAMKLANVNTK